MSDELLNNTKNRQALSCLPCTPCISPGMCNTFTCTGYCDKDTRSGRYMRASFFRATRMSMM